MLAEHGRGGMKARRVDPFQAECFAAFDHIEKIHGGTVAVADEQESDGLVDNVFRGEKTPLFAHELLLEPEEDRVMLIARVPQGEKAAVSMKTSAAPINDAVDIGVFGFAFGTRNGTPANAQKWIIEQGGRRAGIQWLQASGRFAAMGEYEPFTLRDAAQDRLSIFPEFEHGHRLHQVKV